MKETKEGRIFVYEYGGDEEDKQYVYILEFNSEQLSLVEENLDFLLEAENKALYAAYIELFGFAPNNLDIFIFKSFLEELDAERSEEIGDEGSQE